MKKPTQLNPHGNCEHGKTASRHRLSHVGYTGSREKSCIFEKMLTASIPRDHRHAGNSICTIHSNLRNLSSIVGTESQRPAEPTLLSIDCIPPSSDRVSLPTRRCVAGICRGIVAPLDYSIDVGEPNRHHPIPGLKKWEWI